MDNMQLFYYLRDGLGCLGALIGLKATKRPAAQDRLRQQVINQIESQSRW